MFEPQNEQVESPFAPTEIDTAVSDFIATAQAEFGAPEPGESVAPVAAPEPVVEAAPAPGPANPAPAASADAEDRGLARLVAREVELRERETKLSGAEKEIEALRGRLRELEPRALSPELLDKIKLSPRDGLRAIGIDPDELIRTALVEKLGDKADPALKDMIERTRLQKEMAALKAQVQEAERRQAAQAYFNQVANGARDFLGKMEELSKHGPLVSQVAKTNPDRVYAEIMDEITRDAATRARQEPNGDILPYSEAVKRVEARWSEFRNLFGTGQIPPGMAASTPPANPGTETKQNVVKETLKPAPSTIKPPEKPLAPWLKASKDEEDAIRAAIAEYNKSGT